ncbi:MAG: pilus assembly protein PilP [Desulfobulbaceae bacterium]|nr:MAG: pilus assembly protein PilP [Desulfobulbaceae bacterium]
MNAKNILEKIDKFLDDKVVGLDKNIKLAVVAAFVVVPLVAFYFLSYAPQQKQMKQLEAKKISLLQTIRKVEAIAAEIDKHRAEMAEAQLMFQMASNLLPEQQEIPALLTGISDLGSNAGLEILTFKPGKENVQTFYAEIPLSISVQGSYHNIGVFLDRVSKMPRIVSVSSLSLQSPKEEQGEMILKSDVQLETYRFVEEEQQPPQKSTKRRR